MKSKREGETKKKRPYIKEEKLHIKREVKRKNHQSLPYKSTGVQKIPWHRIVYIRTLLHPVTYSCIVRQNSSVYKKIYKYDALKRNQPLSKINSPLAMNMFTKGGSLPQE